MCEPTRLATPRRENEEQFRLLVEQVQDYAIFLISAEGRVATWNVGAERIKGYTAEEIIGKPYETFFTPEDLAAAKPQRLLRRAREEGRVEDEGWRLRKDGSRFWADAVLTALRDSDGRLRGYAKVTRDMSERLWGREQEFLAEASRELAASLDYETTLQRVARLAIPQLADWCAVDVVDERGQVRRITAARRDAVPSGGSQRGPSEKAVDYGVAEVLGTAQSTFIPEVPDPVPADVARDRPQLAALRDLGICSAVLVPLVERGRILGVLTLGRTETSGRRYTRSDLGLAEELGRRAAVAVDNAQLHAAEQRARAAAERLAVITQQVGASLAPEVVLDQIATAATQLLGSAFAGVFLSEMRDGDFILAAGRGLATDAAALRVPRGRSVAGRALAQRRTVLVNDVAADTVAALPALLSGESIGSLIVAPIVAGAEPLGVIEVYAPAPGAFPAEAATLLTGLAGAAAAALTNARLYRDAQEHAAAQAMLNTALREAAQARDRALGQAEASRRHLHELFMQAPAAIAITRGPEHVIELVNPLFLRTVGRRDASDLIGRPAREALADFAERGMLAHADRVFASGETYVGQEVPSRWDRDGDGRMEEGYFTFVLQPYRNPAGEVEGLLSHSVEVTDVVRSRQRVEALVAERDAFLAAASHDLKNPLAAIKATAQFLRRYLERTGGSDPARLATGLATIQETVDRMLGLVNELLDVARLRMGQTLDLDRQTTDLVELARRIVAAQQQATERHRLRVESAVDALVGEWDAARLERVLGNLLENAIKYSPDGGTVVVELAEEDGQALVRVRDQGIGIPLADRERIFEPFQRGSNVGQGIAGTGIGLSGSRQIVEQHGGAISVESEEGAGSTFTVRLPLAGREE